MSKPPHTHVVARSAKNVSFVRLEDCIRIHDGGHVSFIVLAALGFGTTFAKLFTLSPFLPPTLKVCFGRVVDQMKSVTCLMQEVRVKQKCNA